LASIHGTHKAIFDEVHCPFDHRSTYLTESLRPFLKEPMLILVNILSPGSVLWKILIASSSVLPSLLTVPKAFKQCTSPRHFPKLPLRSQGGVRLSELREEAPLTSGGGKTRKPWIPHTGQITPDQHSTVCVSMLHTAEDEPPIQHVAATILLPAQRQPESP
jgi:hypothetical protein